MRRNSLSMNHILVFYSALPQNGRVPLHDFVPILAPKQRISLSDRNDLAGECCFEQSRKKHPHHASLSWVCFNTCLPKGKYQAFFEDQELRTMFMLNVESLQPCRSFSRYLYPLCALCSNTPLTGKRNWLRFASLYRPGVLWQSLLVSNLWHSWPSILLWLKEAAPQGSRDLRKIQMRCGEPCETWKTQQFLVLCFKHLFCCLMQVLCTSTVRSLSVNIWFNVV